MIVIKEVSPEDAVFVTRLSHQLGYPVSEEQTLKNIIATKQSELHEGFVAVNIQEVIGWIGVSYNISLESSPLCEIHGLVVDENYRGKGIGKLLIERAKAWGRSKGIEKLRLRCNVKRTETHKFYMTIGFTEIKQQKVFEISL